MLLVTRADHTQIPFAESPYLSRRPCPGLGTGAGRWSDQLLDELLAQLLDSPEGVDHLPQPQPPGNEGLLHVGGQGGVQGQGGQGGVTVQGPVERSQGPGQDRHE